MSVYELGESRKEGPTYMQETREAVMTSAKVELFLFSSQYATRSAADVPSSVPSPHRIAVNASSILDNGALSSHSYGALPACMVYIADPFPA